MNTFYSFKNWYFSLLERKMYVANMKPFTATDKKISFLVFLTCNNLNKTNNRFIIGKKVMEWEGKV